MGGRPSLAHVEHVTSGLVPYLQRLETDHNETALVAAGTRQSARTSRSRCACTASILLGSTLTKELLGHNNTDAGIASSVSATLAAATNVGRRPEANNIVPGRSHLGQDSHSCGQHAQVGSIPVSCLAVLFCKT